MRCIALLLSVVALGGLLSGCWDMTEINRRTYVLGIGIDESEGGRYAFTFQTADISKDAEQPAKLTNIESTALAPALRELDRSCEYDTTLIHLSCVVLGDSVKADDMGALLGYLFSSSNVRRQCVVAAAEGAAADLLSMSGDSASSMQIATMIEKNDDALRQSENMTLSKLYTTLVQDEGFVVYRISAMQGQQVSATDAAAGLRIAGTNVYESSEFSGELNAEETELARLFSSGQTSGIIAAAGSEGKGFFYRIDRSECKTVCKLRDDGKLVYDISVTVDCSLADWESGSGVAPSEPEGSEIASSLKKRLQALIRRSQQELGAAGVGLDDAVRRQHHRWYLENKNELPRLYSQAQVQLEVVCKN